MNTLIHKFSDMINGVITGFDRIVFKGSIMPLMHEEGAASFCIRHRILNKDFKDWMQTQTVRILDDAERFSIKQRDQSVQYINSLGSRKESIAHDHQRLKKIRSGLIGIWSAVESCVTFKARFDTTAKHPKLSRHWEALGTGLVSGSLRDRSCIGPVACCVARRSGCRSYW